MKKTYRLSICNDSLFFDTQDVSSKRNKICSSTRRVERSKSSHSGGTEICRAKRVFSSSLFSHLFYVL